MAADRAGSDIALLVDYFDTNYNEPGVAPPRKQLIGTHSIYTGLGDRIESDTGTGPGAGQSDANMSSWAGSPSIKGSSEAMRMALLTFSLIGVQFTWGIEMTYGTPYLLNLGLTKSRTSMVWIAGPLSGLIMQPLVGVLSDRSKSKYGRRRPIMMLGSVLVTLCMIVMAWTKEIVLFFMDESPAQKTVTIWVAVLSIYAVDFVINAVMSCCRSLIVDTLPIPKQQAGSAWASRMAAFGHLIGYAAGTVDMVRIFGPAIGDTQFKKLALIAGFGLIFTCGITSWAVTERVLLSSRDADSQKSMPQIVRQIIRMSLTLPPRIQAICWAQFWSWIGWFPFLFYNSTWVGETYFRYDVPVDLRDSKDALGDIGRIGSMSLVVFSTITFLGAFILPFFIRSPDEGGVTPRPPKSIEKVVLTVNKYKPDLLTAWFAGHLVFAFTMFFAPFAKSFRFATTLVALCGLPWVIASWAPNAFLGVEVNRLAATSPAPYTRVRSASIDSEKSSSGSVLSPNFLRLEHGAADDATASTGELSGVYFGILNIYTTLPQFIGTFISTIVFSVLEPGKSPELAHDAHPDEHHSTDGPNAIAVCLVIGSFAMLGAAYATRKLKALQ